MATLTEDELALIRLDLGDGCELISDAQIQLAWDEAASDRCTAYARIAYWMYARVKPQVTSLATGGTAVSTATARLYWERYKHWAACAGEGMGTLQTGVLNLNLDAPCPDGDADCWERWP